MQIAIVLYPGMTALDALGPYEVLRFLPGCELRFVAAELGPDKAAGRVFERARAEMSARARNRRNAVSIPIALWRTAIDRVRKRRGRSGRHTN